MARRTGFREQYYTGTRDISVSGKIAGNIKVKLYIRLRWLFAHISGRLAARPRPPGGPERAAQRTLRVSFMQLSEDYFHMVAFQNYY